jgi:HJR/Mrr/RecB family endonuclease/DNA-directed RNA polymerase subunit RPC12/RpoP
MSEYFKLEIPSYLNKEEEELWRNAEGLRTANALFAATALLTQYLNNNPNADFIFLLKINYSIHLRDSMVEGFKQLFNQINSLSQNDPSIIRKIIEARQQLSSLAASIEQTISVAERVLNSNPEYVRAKAFIDFLRKKHVIIDELLGRQFLFEGLIEEKKTELEARLAELEARRKAEEEENARKKAEFKARRKAEEEENARKKAEHMPRIQDYCRKYLSGKESDFKGVITSIYSDANLFELIDDNKKDALSSLRENLGVIYSQIQNKSPSNSAEYDAKMKLESSFTMAWEFIQDLERIKKILNKQAIDVGYRQLIVVMVELIKDDLTKILDKITAPLYQRISKITTVDKKQIIIECLELGFENDSEMIVANLFDKFGLKYTASEISELIYECKEEIDLETFEKNLGVCKSTKIRHFDGLNGYQFEDWLKELFEIKGYNVIRTKASGDQGADLLIKKDAIKTVVQAKKYVGPVTNKAVQEVVASKKHYDADNAMVVTTGTFTRSAFELAKSNNVELWDGDFLKGIIYEINESDIKKDIFKTTQESSFEKKVDSFFITLECPFCKEQFDLTEEELPARNVSKEEECPACHFRITSSIPDQYYLCTACKKDFYTISERRKHEENCPEHKLKRFKCQSCKKEFTLDDSEFEELKAKGQVNIECPSCKQSNSLNK